MNLKILLKSSKKQDKNIQIKYYENFVNKVSVDPDGIKNNKLIYDLTRDDRDYYIYHNEQKYFGIYPDIYNVFMC
jgi:hypothetical protein